MVPLIEGQSMAVLGKTATGILVRGINPKDLDCHKLVCENIKGGALENFADKNAVVVGVALARSLNLHIGHKLMFIERQK